MSIIYVFGICVFVYVFGFWMCKRNCQYRTLNFATEPMLYSIQHWESKIVKPKLTSEKIQGVALSAVNQQQSTNDKIKNAEIN